MQGTFLSDENFLPHGGAVRHGFFGRVGGVSRGVYASLNCGPGSGDDAADIAENRNRVAAALGVEAQMLLSVRQVHSAQAVHVAAPWNMEQRPEGDAMVTDAPGIALGILTADCGPVLFHGSKADGTPVIGAAHAGWGGALRGILEATATMMEICGAETPSLRACVGPCIGPKSYEVGMDFIAPFLDEDPASEHFFKAGRRDDRLMFDLPGYIAFRLARRGVRHVSITGRDTYADEAEYFSYRRSTHRGETDYGRQISALVIRRA